ncbi:hypothetical protein O988_09728 [Pseudogymnoascus sp. VKM F-3808]|nr:hypothetical protein O988_09728 [Pseudogymnoascus sp. VKM F-3808]
MSHTKKSHEILSRQRSTRQPSHTSTTSHASSASTSTRKPSISLPRTSTDFFSPAFDSTANPFGNELAQVRELAEEYSGGAARRAMNEEEQELFRLGLCKFSAADYAAEIQGLYSEMVGKPVMQQSTMLWI